MAVGEPLSGQILPIEGVTLAATSADIKANNAKDVVVISLCEGATSAGVFTRNAFCAAPVIICKEHLAKQNPRYFVINSGNANAAVGKLGVEDALNVCNHLAEVTGVTVEQVLPFSTGVIGERLPVDKIKSVCSPLVDHLKPDGWLMAAQGIMTTDTRPKVSSKEIDIKGRPVRITGICKGSGMIRPDMATLLVFIATDACVAPGVLQSLLKSAVDVSFNRITIDTDTSTNDSCVLTATHKSAVTISDEDDTYEQFLAGLSDLCGELAREIVKDGEGASKFVEVNVEGGVDSGECLRVAYAVAESPLVKTAVFASDANWGRIVMAIGKAGLKELDVNRVDVYLGAVRIVHGGQRDNDYREEHGAAEMAKTEISIRVCLGRGEASECVWTCDLSHDYVSINADYRT
jgi:glutamate N-acetyltransferase/amino-acid N-acetyltransferase